MKFSVCVKFAFTAFLLILYLNRVHGAPANDPKNKGDDKPSTSSGASNSQNNQSGQSGKKSESKGRQNQSKQSQQGQNSQSKKSGDKPEIKTTQSQGQPAKNVESQAKSPENKAAQDQSKRKSSDQSTQSRIDTQPSNQTNSAAGSSKPLTAQDFANQKTEIISCPFSYNHVHKIPNKQGEGQVSLFKIYSYEVTKGTRDKIKNAKAIIQVTFNTIPFEFYDLSKLPSREHWGYPAIFTCSHNKPVMFRIKITEGERDYHYYYAMDAEVKKSRNIGLTTLDEPPETDSKGLTRHPVPSDLKDEDYCKKLEKIWTKTFENVCKEHKEVSSSSPIPSALKITSIPPAKQSKKGGK